MSDRTPLYHVATVIHNSGKAHSTIALFGRACKNRRPEACGSEVTLFIKEGEAEQAIALRAEMPVVHIANVKAFII